VSSEKRFRKFVGQQSLGIGFSFLSDLIDVCSATWLPTWATTQINCCLVKEPRLKLWQEPARQSACQLLGSFFNAEKLGALTFAKIPETSKGCLTS
jgi:hypothetical protein